MMKKNAMKAFAMMITVVMALTGFAGAMAEGGSDIISLQADQYVGVGDIVDVFAEDALVSGGSDGSAVQEPRKVRVTFYDLGGEEIDYVVINEGGYVEAPDFRPEIRGLLFQFWYDEMGQLVPYTFGSKVAESINLVPYYLIDETYTGNWQDNQTVLVAADAPISSGTQVSDLIDLVVGGGQNTQPSASNPESAAILIESIVGGGQTAPGKPEAMTDNQVASLIDEIVGTPAAAPAPKQDAMSEVAVSTLLSDIIGSADAPQSEPAQPQDNASMLLEELLAAPAEAPAAQESAPVNDADALLDAILAGADEGVTLSSNEETPKADDNAEAMLSDLLAEGETAEPVADEPVSENDDALIDSLLDEMMSGFVAAPAGDAAAETPKDGAAMTDDSANALLGDMLSDLIAVEDETAAEDETPAEEADDEDAVVVPDETPAEGDVLEGEIADDDNSGDLITIEDEETPLSGPEPFLTVSYDYDGDLVVGTQITISANLSNYQGDLGNVQFQWQNDANGAFEDVAGATGQTYVFVAADGNTDCQWRVNVTISE